MKKTIAGIIAAGGLAGGTLVVSDKVNCDYEFILDEETICLSEEEMQIIQQEIQDQNFQTVGELTFE